MFCGGVRLDERSLFGSVQSTGWWGFTDAPSFGQFTRRYNSLEVSQANREVSSSPEFMSTLAP